MALVNHTLTTATRINSQNITNAAEHGDSMTQLVLELMRTQKEAKQSIQGVKTELDEQARDMAVKKSEVNILLAELDKTRPWS